MTLPTDPITQVRELPLDELAPLTRAALAEDFRAVQVLIEDWRSGENRFDRPGEAVFVARLDGALVGVCGLNRDMLRDAGRVRRLYVLPEHRRKGVGRRLVAAVSAKAVESFPELVLRTLDPAAASFYEALGFSPEPGELHMHRLVLGRHTPGLSGP